MKKGSLPQTIETRALAARQVTLAGRLDAAKLPRLAAAVRGLDAPADVVAEFKRNEEGRYVVDLAVTMDVQIACDRCLEAMPLTVTSGTRLGIVWTDEQAQALASGVEPLLTGDETDLWQVVEDELLLALPPFSYHSAVNCAEQTGRVMPPEIELPAIEVEDSGNNPFSVLVGLKDPSD